MNAVVEHAMEARMVLLKDLRVSNTAVQQLRRAHFDPAALLELADSVAKAGVLQPLLVRALDGKLFEIVAGERRFLAADRAGLPDVPVIVRPLSDAECLVAQLIENKHREGYSAIEEAVGYAELRTKDTGAEEIGKMIGKSRSYVYARLKLLDLEPSVRERLDTGRLDASHALAIARIPSHKLQKKAADSFYPGQSLKHLVDRLRNGFTQPLDRAPFPLDRGYTEPATKAEIKVQATPGIACHDCPHNSANDAELLDALDGARVCTHVPCFEAKVVRHYTELRELARARGQTVIEGEAAAKLLPGRHSASNMDGRFGEGYISLDTDCDFVDNPNPEPETDYDSHDPAWQAFEAWEPPTWRALLADHLKLEDVVLVENPHAKGAMIECLPYEAVRPLLKLAKVKVPKGHLQAKGETGTLDLDPGDAEAARREREKEDARRTLERAYRDKLFRAVFAKWKGPLKRADLERIVEWMISSFEVEGTLSDLLDPEGKGIAYRKLNEADLVRLMVLAPVSGETIMSHDKPGALLELAARFRIDPKKIKAEVAAELKAAAKAKAAA